MRHYNKIKNIIVAFLVGFIYHKYIVPSVPVLKEIFALVLVILAVLAFLEYLDERFKPKRKALKKDLP